MVKRVFVLISFAVSILVIGENAFAQNKTSKTSIPEPSLGPEWKLIDRDPDGSTAYFNTKKITHLPKGIVEVRALFVLRGETRREFVNSLKHDLTSKGEDPNNAEKLWYFIGLDKLNCNTNQFAILELNAYSFGQAVLDHKSLQHEKWEDIPPGSVEEGIEKYVCKSEALIPEPSLSSRWKLVARANVGSTIYVDTKRITRLPNGIVKVWELWVPRGEMRRGLVNDLKKLLPSEGENPNKAERLWYYIQLDKVDCKKHQSAILEHVDYSFEQAVLYDASAQHGEWDKIIPGSVEEEIEKYVCKKHKEKK